MPDKIKLRIQEFLFIVLILQGCQTQENNHDTVATSQYRSDLIYFGDLNYLPETGEFSTSIYLYPHYQTLSIDSLLQLTDSTIFEDRTIRRRNFPAHLARRYFLIFDLDSLSIYDLDHRFVSKAYLQRIEFFENSVDRKFVAVFRPARELANPEAEYYCVANRNPELLIKGFASKTIVDESLDEFILHQLNIDTYSGATVTNLEVEPFDITYSVVNNSDGSMITELKQNNFRILKRINSTFRIERILPLPYEVNGRPLLLASLSKPKVAGQTTSLFVCNDIDEYRILSFNRLKYK